MAGDRLVIIGGGHAGASLCAGLAKAGLGARVDLLCEEGVLPYQRPPLSKTFLKHADEPLQWHRSEDWFSGAGITVHRGDPAVAIDRVAQEVTLRSGRKLPYERLVLATGTRARRLPQLPEHMVNVDVLRTAADAQRWRSRLRALGRLTVIGGGFIGLEVAASARALGKAVTVLESAPRLLMRSVSSDLSAHVLHAHREAGIDIQLGVRVGSFEIEGDRLVALEVDAEYQRVDSVLLGIGAVPEFTLARQAGLDCDNGIIVDAHMRTSDPAILAVGDCTSFPTPEGSRLRLESVQNANDQARAAVATLTGADAPYRAVPWFWSEQGSLRLQMAGLIPPCGTHHRRPGATPSTFSLLHYQGDRLCCVESVNAPADHIAARQLLDSARSPDPHEACDPARPLRSFL
jgi:3-phenylpropionate/trans-cinnamate dioxygenase ferredoxin reductase subunit